MCRTHYVPPLPPVDKIDDESRNRKSFLVITIVSCQGQKKKVISSSPRHPGGQNRLRFEISELLRENGSRP